MSKHTLLASSVLALAAALPAHAQEPAQGPSVDIIVVTAQKQQQNILDVPINIAVADQATLDLLSADDIEEYADFVPGLQVQAQSLNTSSYSLRGVTSDGGRPRVAVFENGVSIGAPRFGANTAMFDLERVEVVKGPQATLFGQGALVGGINFIQNRASLSEQEGWLKFDGGDYGYVRGEAGYNMLIGDTAALRVAGLVKNRRGYVPNALNGPDFMGQDTTALRAAFGWEPIDALRLDFIVNHEKNDSTGTQFKSMVFAPAGGDLSPYTATANNITPDQKRDSLGSDREIFSATLNVEWEINDAWTLTSLTGARSLSNFEAVDSDGAAFSLLQFASDDNAQVWSQELRLNYDDGGPLTAFFGGNFQTIDHSIQLRLVSDEAYGQALLAPRLAAAAGLTVPQVKALLGAFGVPGAANLDNIANPMRYSAILAMMQLLQTGSINPALLVPLHDRHIEEQFSNGEQTSYDLFGDVTYALNDRLSLTAGLRYTKDELYSDALVYLVNGNPFLGGTRNAVTGGTTIIATDDFGVPRARSHDAEGAYTWRLNAAYRLTDDVNTWAAIGRGRRPPSLSARECAAGSPGCDAETARTGFEVVSAETYDNIEAGLTGMFFGGRMQATASAYYGEYTDFQTTRYDVGQGTFITENSGNATSYGFEFDSRIAATDYIDLLATYAYAHATYDKTDSDGNPLEYAGNRFRLSPEHAFSVAANMRLPVSAGEFFFVPTYIWKDGHFFEDDNEPHEYQKSYGLLDLKLGFDHATGIWGAAVYLENALDKEYLIDAGNTGGEFGIPTAIRGMPRMLGAGVWAKF